MNITPMPAKTTFAFRSRSVRAVASFCVPAFFRSEMARRIPMARLLRIRNSVYAAPTNMPPTAMGRTMNRQTPAARSLQEPSVAPGGRVVLSCGPRK